MELLKLLLEEIEHSDGYCLEAYGEDSASLVPSEECSYYMPNIVIKSVEELESTLNEYINLIKESPKRFYKLDERYKVNNYLFYLVKSLSNTDCQDFTNYVKRFISYLNDTHFSELDYSLFIGKMHEYDISVRRCEEFYGSETPYTMRFFAEVPGFKFEMPLVRYGISEDDTAYIYSIQRKRLYKNKSTRVKNINGVFNSVNSGVKHNRDITPSMLCSLAIFMGMLQSENINQIKVDGFLTRRYGYYNGINEEEQRNEISHNSIDKFLKLFLRLADQFEGVEITAYPFDVDSYLHMSIGENVYSSNVLLDNLYNLGLTHSKQEQPKSKKLTNAKIK